MVHSLKLGAMVLKEFHKTLKQGFKIFYINLYVDQVKCETER